jgi:hypothetical protein
MIPLSSSRDLSTKMEPPGSGAGGCSIHCDCDQRPVVPDVPDVPVPPELVPLL